jgi:hypothetical protein
MQCRIKTSLFIVVGIVFSFSVHADFNEATKAYLLGEFEKARYEALIAATDGKPEAQMLLGQLYFNGEGVEKDIKAALYWYEKAATQDFADAQYRLGSLYFDGKHNIPKDYDKAYQWLQMALENGNKKAKPKVENLFKLDSGKVVNLSESLDVLQEVANKGNKQARFLYSQRLLKGTGFPQDKVKAVALLTEDAKQGFVKAQKRLGELYYHGDGVDQDYYEAYAWSMAYAGTRQLGGLAREGKQTARSALRKLDDEKHHDAYVKSKQYFEKFVLPFHPNAREVGPEKYRIVVRSRKAQLAQAKQQGKGAALAKSPVTAGTAKVSSSAAKRLCESIKSQNKNIERTKEDVTRVFDTIKIEIDSIYSRALEKNANLKGRFEYEIDIDPAGRVIRIDKRASSTLDAPEFEAELIGRIKKINFCKKGTKLFTVAYPIDFMPSKIVSTKNEQAVLARTMAAVERNQGLSNNKQKVVSKLPLIANPELTKAIPAKPPTETLAGSTRETTAAATGISVEKTQAEAQKPSSTEVNVNAAQAKPGESAATATETTSQGEKSVAASTGVAKSVISQSQPAATQTAAAKPDNEKTVIEKRDYREVHNMFIRHRSNINGIYLRAHEQDNSLKGRIVLDLAIAASGKVEKVSITSSDLDSSVLQEELIDYIKRMSFESKNADLYNITYPLDFLP